MPEQAQCILTVSSLKNANRKYQQQVDVLFHEYRLLIVVLYFCLLVHSIDLTQGTG
jgi:hypothetical protein